jgi:hypothetical protein
LFIRHLLSSLLGLNVFRPRPEPCGYLRWWKVINFVLRLHNLDGTAARAADLRLLRGVRTRQLGNAVDNL